MVVLYDELYYLFICLVEYLEKYVDFYYELGEKVQDDLVNKLEHYCLWVQVMLLLVGDDGFYYYLFYFVCNDFVDD